MISRWCDRSIHDVRHSASASGHLSRSPYCLELSSRKPSWPAFMSERTHRPDIWMQTIWSKRCPTPCEEGAVHIWLMWSAHADAAPLALAGCAVRYAAVASDQDCSAHRGDEDASSLVPAEGDTGSSDLHAPADAHAASQPLSGRADCPPRPTTINPNACQLPEPTQRTAKADRKRPMGTQLTAVPPSCGRRWVTGADEFSGLERQPNCPTNGDHLKVSGLRDRRIGVNSA